MKPPKIADTEFDITISRKGQELLERALAVQEFERAKKELNKILAHYFWSRIALALIISAVGSAIVYICK